VTPRNHINAVNFSTAARRIAENSACLPADGRRRSKSAPIRIAECWKLIAGTNHTMIIGE